MRHRLGRVSRMERARFRIPAAAAGAQLSYQVERVAEPVGTSPAFSTGRFVWRPGQNLSGRVCRNVQAPAFLVAAH